MQQNTLPANVLADKHSYTVSPCGKLPEEKRFCPDSLSADSCARCYRGTVNVSWSVSLDEPFSTNPVHTFLLHRGTDFNISHVAIHILVILLRCRQQDSTPASTQIHWSTSLPLCCGAGFCWLIVPRQQHEVCLATAGERFSPSQPRLPPAYWQSGPTLTARLL